VQNYEFFIWFVTLNDREPECAREYVVPSESCHVNARCPRGEMKNWHGACHQGDLHRLSCGQVVLARAPLAQTTRGGTQPRDAYLICGAGAPVPQLALHRDKSLSRVCAPRGGPRSRA
jgi:hypothetical protein